MNRRSRTTAIGHTWSPRAKPGTLEAGANAWIKRHRPDLAGETIDPLDDPDVLRGVARATLAALDEDSAARPTNKPTA